MVEILENETFSSFLKEHVQLSQLLIGWYNPVPVADWLVRIELVNLEAYWIKLMTNNVLGQKLLFHTEKIIVAASLSK